MTNKKIELLIKILTSKEFNDYGFSVRFELDKKSTSTKENFNVKFRNPKKTSWTLNSLEQISILIVEDLCKVMSIPDHFFAFPRKWGINYIFMDEELVSDNEDYFLSNKVKNDLKNYFDNIDIIEHFITKKGDFLIYTKPYKYKLISYKGDSTIGFEIFFKIKSLLLNDKEIKINDKNLMSFIVGYLNYETYPEQEDDIAGDIYGILEDEFNLKYTNDYVNSYIIADRGADNKKIVSEMTFDKEDIIHLLNQYLSND